MWLSRARRPFQQSRPLDISSQITPSNNHEQHVSLRVIEALTGMSVHLSTAEIDAVTPQADSSNVDDLYSQRPVVKKRKCLANGSQPQHFETEAIPSFTHAGNTLQETQHTARTSLLPQPTLTNPEAPTSPNKPTLILTAPTPLSPRHQDQSQTEPQSPPSGSRSHFRQPHQPLPQYHFRIATPTTPTQKATTNFPKKRKRYGTAYEVFRARQIQATGVPRLRGPCHSCARRQRQLDEVAAAAAVAAAGNVGGGLIGTGTRTGIGRFARPQRGDEFLPCTVLSNGSGHADGGGTGTGGGNRGTGTGPTPCARCKSIKMKCEG
ncbi:uncharacterized protein B0T23DRAFT_445131 [Neurospora hispaniola]|uniref:Uncharacterized protein n=1 Tax=Neurospora hispaniola TaxID=588809 RepID=A0AAJ0I3B5_9PEZI|nr:hypothetical protein B0T23DRAFT_445131 [Neurospora hispaniola]